MNIRSSRHEHAAQTKCCPLFFVTTLSILLHNILVSIHILYYQYLYSTPGNQPNNVIEPLVCDVIFLSLPQNKDMQGYIYK